MMGGDKMNIPFYGEKIVKKLKNEGFEAYFVGGCVRDSIMGREVNDYDITTNATPEEIKKVFVDFKTILTGEKHGTVTVVSEGENIEVTTFRVDGEYKDLRHPESVSFTENVKEDLARRDFTVNAICYDGEFTDPFGGIEDIKRKIIRCVGDADKRFNEDALRIMRAVRFSSVLGFEIEEETKKSIRKNAHLLKSVSPERLYSELSKLLMGENAEKVLTEYSCVLAAFIPYIKPCVGFDQKNVYHIYDVYTHMVKATVNAPFNLKIRLAAYLHDIGKPAAFTFDGESGHFKGHDERSEEMAREILELLKVDNDTKNTVCALVREHQREILPEKKYVKRFLGRFSSEFFDMLMELKRADTLAHSSLAMKNLEVIEKLKELKEEIERENECVRVKDLDITGFDLMDIGIEGKEIGRVMKLLLEMVIDGEAENEKPILLEKAKLTKKSENDILK